MSPRRDTLEGMSSLETLPAPGARRLAVRVTSDATRHIAAGHPWVYDDSITSVSHDGAPGDLAVIFDRNRQFLAIGLWDPSSPIRIKVLHHGRPTTIDATFWSTRLAAALARRSSIVDRGDTTGYRLIHGENDGFPGLVLDRYDRTLVLKLYSESWIPHLATLVPVFDAALAPERIVLRFARTVQARHGLEEGQPILGSAPDGPVRFLEHGLTFEADVVQGQKTGHFLDQRDNRSRVGRASRGKRVLDVFACTGGFSVHAAAGGAASVVSVDQSAPALETAERNMALNLGLATVRHCRHSIVVGDAFDLMAGLHQRNELFDVVVVDPPSFAQRQSSVDRAIAAYARLTRLAVALLSPDGLLVQASCSSRVDADRFVDTVMRAARDAGRPLREIERTGHPADHPIGFTEGAYLKAIFATAPTR
jgi:23S rRNA (cytosine1962-C5)-methyltransferase